MNYIYRLEPLYDSNLPAVKKEITVDPDVISGSQVEILESLYNEGGEDGQRITIAATNQFTYTLSKFQKEHLMEHYLI